MNDTLIDKTELRLAALRFLKEWSTWMVGVETLLMGFLVSLLTGDRITLGSIYLKGAVVCFGISIMIAAWLLGAIPSLSQRLPMATEGIYRMPLFSIFPLKYIRVGWVTFLQHLFFFLGMLGIVASILLKQIG
jgi:hypothetical protein